VPKSVVQFQSTLLFEPVTNQVVEQLSM